MKAIVTVWVAIFSLGAVAQTGKITAAKSMSVKDAVKTQLELKPYETRVVVVR